MVTAYRQTYKVTVQVSWLGVSLHSSTEPSEILHWPCYDDIDSTINIDIIISCLCWVILPY